MTNLVRACGIPPTFPSPTERRDRCRWAEATEPLGRAAWPEPVGAAAEGVDAYFGIRPRTPIPHVSSCTTERIAWRAIWSLLVSADEVVVVATVVPAAGNAQAAEARIEATNYDLAAIWRTLLAVLGKTG